MYKKYKSNHTQAMRITLALTMLMLGLWGLIASSAMNSAAQNPPSNQTGSQTTITVINFSQNVDRVSERYLEREIAGAKRRGDALVVITLDTPGGLLDATRNIVEILLTSDLPVVVYVYPQGAQAASAGALIAAAGSFLAMAPATNIGAASPVLGMGEDIPETLSNKVFEDTAAFARSIADSRNRNAEALQAMVVDAKSFTAKEATDQNVADGVFSDLDALLQAIDQHPLPTSNGQVSIATAGATIRTIEPNLLDQFLSIIADPNIAYLLVSLGGLALIVELWNFGSWIPGTLGVFMLAIGFAGIGFLPFSWAGMALILLGLVLLVAEVYIPGFGFFGILGAVCLVLGGLFLFGFFGTPSLPGSSVNINRWFLVGVGATVGLFALWLAREIRASRRASGYTSAVRSDMLIGTRAEVTIQLNPEGQVLAAGEEWTARLFGEGSAEVGESLTISDVSGLMLHVVREPDNQQ